MISVSREVNDILSELLSADGNETHVRDASCFVHPGENATFFTVMARARAMNETAIGFIDGSRAGHEGGGVVLNPDRKSEARVWNMEKDKIIVLAED
eukprot:COSAG05_NODE_890_length_6734_cov_2.541824_3_plen_97_part_00